MQEKYILLIAFIGSLTGLLILFFLSEKLEYNEETIEKITAERIKEMVKIKGEIGAVRHTGNTTFLSVKQPTVMDVVVFSNISLFKGEQLEIIGRGEEYNNKMEVIAHRIRVIT